MEDTAYSFPRRVQTVAELLTWKTYVSAGLKKKTHTHTPNESAKLLKNVNKKNDLAPTLQ